MTKSPIERIARTFQLTDLSYSENLDDTFEMLVRLIVWRMRKAKEPGEENDKLLYRQKEDGLTRLLLFLHFAVHDPAFFKLAKRMAVNETRKSAPSPPYFQAITGQLLSMEEPKQVRTLSTRDALIVMAIRVKSWQGYRPYGVTDKNAGSINLLEKRLEAENSSLTNDALQSIWKQKEIKLFNAGFKESEISEFFEETSPMQSYSD